MEGPLFMVFDVESVGLHGDGFAVAWVIVNRRGDLLDSAAYSCNPSLALGDERDREWVREHVTVPAAGRLQEPEDIREAFWRAWLDARGRGAVLVADCCWPVEARFLIACIDDDPDSRRWEGPYPLYDLASIRLAAGLDPLETCERLPEELPAHNPLADARQSARLLIEALDRIGKEAAP